MAIQDATNTSDSNTHDSRVLLTVEDLVKFFPIARGLFKKQQDYVHAVDHVSFSLEKQKTLGFVGESGCGKSTLARTILRLIEPTSGKIIYNNVDITKVSQYDLRSLRKEMQMIFQDPVSSLNPRMSIRDILSEPFDIHKLNRNKSEREDILINLLKEVDLKENALDRYPHEFSGGQRQRIGIARALALHPKLIICDEPVSALDVSIQNQILNLMMDLRDKFGLSYIFIAHSLAVIEHISDDVAVMYLGKIVEFTSAENLYLKPLHPYTQALISSIPQHTPQKRVRQVLQGDIPDPIHPPLGCRFHTRCPHAKDICKNVEPEFKNYGTEEDKHFASCHFAEKFIK